MATFIQHGITTRSSGFEYGSWATNASYKETSASLWLVARDIYVPEDV